MAFSEVLNNSAYKTSLEVTILNCSKQGLKVGKQGSKLEMFYWDFFKLSFEWKDNPEPPGQSSQGLLPRTTFLYSVSENPIAVAFVYYFFFFLFTLKSGCFC